MIWGPRELGIFLSIITYKQIKFFFYLRKLLKKLDSLK